MAPDEEPRRRKRNELAQVTVRLFRPPSARVPVSGRVRAVSPGTPDYRRCPAVRPQVLASDDEESSDEEEFGDDDEARVGPPSNTRFKCLNLFLSSFCVSNKI